MPFVLYLLHLLKDVIDTKAVVVVGGFALLELLVTPDGKRVFLFVVTTIPNAMRRMATTAGMVKKAAVGRSKSPPLAVKKQLLVVAYRREQ